MVMLMDRSGGRLTAGQPFTVMAAVALISDKNLTVAIVVVLLNRLEFWSRVSTRVSHDRMSSGQQGVLAVRVSSSMIGPTRSTGQPGSNPVKPVNSS
ncbi:hypothetical protein Hdeb2414_s0028g00701691 [Helianthus debilis subsp. tardiflorus]